MGGGDERKGKAMLGSPIKLKVMAKQDYIQTDDFNCKLQSEYGSVGVECSVLIYSDCCWTLSLCALLVMRLDDGWCTGDAGDDHYGCNQLKHLC